MAPVFLLFLVFLFSGRGLQPAFPRHWDAENLGIPQAWRADFDAASSVPFSVEASAARWFGGPPVCVCVRGARARGRAGVRACVCVCVCVCFGERQFWGGVVGH